MPAMGVYPYTTELYCALVDSCYALSDRSILCDLLIQPILDIHRDVQEGLNPFIGRERYRAWLNSVSETIGPIDLPDWDTLEQNDEWSWRLYNEIEANMSLDWEIFFDKEAEIESAISQMTTSEVDVDELLRKVDQLSKPGYFLALVSNSLGCIYIISSPDIENRGPCSWNTREGYHMYESVADGEEPGPLATYVLPEEISTAWRDQE